MHTAHRSSHAHHAAPSQTITEPVPSDPNSTLTSRSTSPHLQTLPVAGTLRLRGDRARGGRRVQWTQQTVDNEGLGRKSSKICCIYHRPRHFDSSSSSSSDSDSDSYSDSASARSADEDAGMKDAVAGEGVQDKEKGQGKGKAQRQKRQRGQAHSHEEGCQHAHQAQSETPYSKESCNEDDEPAVKSKEAPGTKTEASKASVVQEREKKAKPNAYEAGPS